MFFAYRETIDIAHIHEPITITQHSTDAQKNNLELGILNTIYVHKI